MSELSQYLPLIIPLALIEVGLMVAALVHISTHNRYRFGNRLAWVLVAILINIIGPLLYFIIGRSDDSET